MSINSRLRTGYTFVEMTITVLVMGIMAAIAAPTYVSVLANYRSDMTVRKIIADLEYARAEAMRSSQSRTIEFDVSANSYTLLNVTDIDNSANVYVINVGEEPFVSTLVSADFGGDTDVIFDMHGRPDSVGTVVVQSGAVQKTINLAADGVATSP